LSEASITRSFRSAISTSWLRFPGCGASSWPRLRIDDNFLYSFHIVHGQTRDCVKVSRAHLAYFCILRNEVILRKLSPL
ncbi:hypothetical protein GIB67_003778, partial [Kingdonia uniflora]